MVADRGPAKRSTRISTHARQLYRALDERCQRLTEREFEVGRFDFLH